MPRFLTQDSSAVAAMLAWHHGIGRCLFLPVLLLCTATISEAAAAGGAAAAAGNRLEMVGQLIDHSSAAQQIAASGNEAALAGQKAAREIYERAVQAQHSGDADEAKRLLDEATRKMFEAVRMAKPDSVVGDKKRADFKQRLDSLHQLQSAYERVGKDKDSDAGKAEVDGPVREKLARAEALFQAGQLDEARVALDEAHASIKSAIIKLHGGDTVVRSLKFDTREEEYRYELDRNDTHRMLLNGILDDHAERPELRKQAQPFVDRAAELRHQAESAGAAKSYDKAIEGLEESTAQLIRAIRAAGVYVPG